MEISKVNDFLKVCQELENKSVNIKTVYKLAKLHSLLQTEADFYSTKLQGIIQKYGEVDEEGKFIFVDNGSAVKIKEGMLDNCRKEIEELNNFTVQLPDIHFTLDEFEGLELTLSQIEVFLDFIEE